MDHWSTGFGGGPGAATVAGVLGLLLALPAAGERNEAGAGPEYTQAQAERARIDYATHCASCHGGELEGTNFGPPLRGVDFRRRWAAEPLAELHRETRAMPPGAAGSLGDAAYSDLVALMLSANGIEAGDAELPADRAALAAMVMPGEPQPGPRSPPIGGGLTPGAEVPYWPTRRNPLDSLRPVTDELLASPPDGAWLQWRRTWDGQGYSPLDAINRDNVHGLRSVWSLTLPPGPNTVTPLVHDGVLFVYGFGDHVFAVDAATGDELWHYARDLPEGRALTSKRNLAIHGERLYLGTTDMHVIALDVRTGEPVWETDIDAPGLESRLTGGPLVAQGVVMQGTVTRGPGGAHIAGLDAETGEELWRFHTIARPDEPGGDSWNALPLEQRSGGSVWTAGYYDTESGLAYFGPAPTYDTLPLLHHSGEPGVTQDALFTNATVALDPATGERVWHYQHMANDQWDLDWSFERHVIDLPDGNGDGMRRLVLTGGKIGVFDAMDAATGEYAFSFDLGIQDLVLDIDPVTGEKLIDETLIPGDGELKTLCPHAGGGKNWNPASYDPDRHVLYVPVVESCMNLTPAAEGETTMMSTGFHFSIHPPPDSDGRFGRLQAVDVLTGEAVWTHRQRAPFTSGVLATAGDVVFGGAIDRRLHAWDAADGRELWSTRLNDVPTGAPITYEVDGRQYVAVVVAFGTPLSATYQVLVPEVTPVVAPGAALWVFALPD